MSVHEKKVNLGEMRAGVPEGDVVVLGEALNPLGTVLHDKVFTIRDDILNQVVGIDNIAVSGGDTDEGIVVGEQALGTKADRRFAQQLRDLTSLGSDRKNKTVVIEANLHEFKRLLRHVHFEG